MIYRSTIQYFIRHLILDEIPEIVIVLLAISLDSSTSAIIQQEIAVVLDAVFCSIADLNVVAEIVRSLVSPYCIC